MAKSASQVAQKWASRLGAATQAVKDGVQSVTVSPTSKAASQASAYLNGVQEAVSSGKWQRGLNRVSLADWQNAMLNKGVNRIATGATAAIPKMEQFQSQWLPYMDQLKAKLNSMPRGDKAANQARMNAAFEHNSNFRRQA